MPSVMKVGALRMPPWLSTGAAPPANRVGGNSLRLDYYQTEIPFLNVLKGSRGGSSFNSWNTSGTDHPSNLQLDADGYPTSLTGLDSTVYTSIHTAVFVGISSGTGTAPPPPPGITSLYPAGSWRLRVTGKFVLTMGGDATGVACGTAGCSVSSNQVTSTQTGQAVITFNTTTPTSGGIFITISSIPDAANYPRAMDLVNSTWTAIFDAGEIFNPNFLACLQAADIQIYRNMDWACINSRTPQVQFSSTPASGSTGGTINGMFSDGTFSGTSWPMPTGTYNALFSDGIVRACGFTAYSSSVTWASLSATQTNASIYPSVAPWSARTLPSNMMWSGQHGPPEEVFIALGNKAGIDLHHCFGFDSDSTEWTAVANMYKDGTGCQGGIATSGLNSGRKVYFEMCNEVWNAGFPQQKYGNYLSQGLFGVQNNQQSLGNQSALAADAIFAVFGSSAYASRVVFGVGCQTVASGSTQLADSMNISVGGTAAYLHHLGAIYVAPYFDESALSTPDITTAFATADPILTVLQLAYSNVVGGHTYTSIDANGYIGLQVTRVAAIISGISAQPWNTFPIIGYEGGDNFKDGSGGSVVGWKAKLWDAYRDTRFQYLYFDPNKVIDGVHTGYLQMMKDLGLSWINIYQTFSELGQGGFSYAIFETSQQAAQLPTLPAKALGIKNFAVGP